MAYEVMEVRVLLQLRDSALRGGTERQAALLLGSTPNGFVPKDHPLRRLKLLVDSALARMSPLFDQLGRGARLCAAEGWRGRVPGVLPTLDSRHRLWVGESAAGEV